MKKLFLAAFAPLFLAGLMGFRGWFIPEQAGSQRDDAPIVLARAFTESGARFVFRNTNGWLRVDEEYHSLEELERMAWEAGRFFELEEDVPIDSTEINGVRQVLLRGSNAKQQTISVIIHSAREQGGFGTYLVVDAVGRDSVFGMAAMEADMLKYFQRYGGKPMISHCIHGVLDKLLDSDEITALQKNIFQAVAAREVEGLDQDGFISMSGYTKEIVSKISSPQGDINLQLALRRNESEGCIFIWIGTPVITLEY
ncbi:MAG: YwmB family TATA-box binding protein [Clostridia bacterium]|jgi:hypothetical protein